MGVQDLDDADTDPPAGLAIADERAHLLVITSQARAFRLPVYYLNETPAARGRPQPFLESLDLRRITLVCQDWGGLIGLRLVAEDSERFARVVAANTFLPTGDQKPPEAFFRWRDFSQRVEVFPTGFILQSATVSELPADVLAAYDAPYPDESYKAGVRAWGSRSRAGASSTWAARSCSRTRRARAPSRGCFFPPESAMSLAILIIDDEPTLVKNIRVYLGRHGHDTESAGSAEEGLELLERFQPDVVLLDFHLPGINGLEALGRIRERRPDAKVVMITGHSSVKVAVDAMKAGAYDYGAKPVVLGELKLLLDRAAGQDRIEHALDYYTRREGRDAGTRTMVGESPGMRELKQTIGRLLES